MNKLKILKHTVGLYTFIFIVWGLYRYLFRLPMEIEEIVLKPLIWLLPLFIVIRKEKENWSSIGWSGKNLFKSIYLGVGLGIIFALEGFFAHNLKYGTVNLVKLSFATGELLLIALGISFVTALCEETVFRGFIFSRLLRLFNNEWTANLITSTGWAFIHFPVTIFTLKYSPDQMFIYLLLTFIFGFASSFVFFRTKTIVAPVLLHVFWSWPINLFR